MVGPEGPTGLQGPVGPQGPVGSQGPAGPEGPAGTWSAAGNQPFLVNDGDSLSPGIAFSGDIASGLYRSDGGDAISLTSRGVQVVRAKPDEFRIFPPTRINDGTPTSPGLGFIGAPSSGFYRSDGGSAFSMAADGVQVFRAKPNEVAIFHPLRISRGTAASPGFGFIEDPSSGLYQSDGGGAVSLSAGGIQVVRAKPNEFAIFQPARVSGGTAALPGFGFIEDPSSGLYQSDGGSAVSLTAAGVQVVRAKPNEFAIFQPVRVNDGSASAPGISFIEDSASGLFRSDGGSAISFAIEGVQVVRVKPKELAILDPAGFLTAHHAVLTNAATSGIHYLGDGSAGAPSLTYESDPTFGWYRSDAGDAISITLAGYQAFRFKRSELAVISEGGQSVVWKQGTGSPEGVVAAPVGSLYTRTDGGPGSTLYVKEAGIDANGWAAK